MYIYIFSFPKQQKATGTLYYDYVNQRVRTDVQIENPQNTTHVSVIQLDKQNIVYTLYGVEGQKEPLLCFYEQPTPLNYPNLTGSIYLESQFWGLTPADYFFSEVSAATIVVNSFERSQFIAVIPKDPSEQMVIFNDFITEVPSDSLFDVPSWFNCQKNPNTTPMFQTPHSIFQKMN